MQLSNLTLRLGGSMLHTVPKFNCTPAEILILQAIHGADATVDIRPTRYDKKIIQSHEWERLAKSYDNPGSMVATPGEESRSVMARLFPGIMKKLPTTLKEIGLGHLLSAASIKAADAGMGASAVLEVADVDLGPNEDEDYPTDDAEAAEATIADARNDERAHDEHEPGSFRRADPHFF